MEAAWKFLNGTIPQPNFTLYIFIIFSEENTPLDLDDHGGRTFLRVLLHLTMHDYPPLVSGALQLLFRHFSQRQEVLQAFKQVNVVFYTVHTFTLNLCGDARVLCN